MQSPCKRLFLIAYVAFPLMWRTFVLSLQVVTSGQTLRHISFLPYSRVAFQFQYGGLDCVQSHLQISGNGGPS